MKSATLVGRDSLGDIAVLQTRLPSSVKPLEIGDSTNLTIGEPVFALGSPAGLVSSITSGVVSQANRTGISILPMIQTDAPINPGNSGGPLINKEGRVIGINTAKLTPISGFEGLGFAIPSSIASRIIPSLIESGRYDHPFIGVQGVFIDPLQVQVHNLPESVKYGYLIQEIIEGTAASSSDLRIGDVILKLAVYPVRQAHDIPYVMEHFYSSGEEVTLEVLRGEQTLSITLTLGIRPE
ncbi:MAG: PDZ domain-containing protein [Nitrososphaeria archaeon]|nr:PDZ domain-containing protein [Nitrososphaeria archaeon]